MAIFKEVDWASNFVLIAPSDWLLCFEIFAIFGSRENGIEAFEAVS